MGKPEANSVQHRIPSAGSPAEGIRPEGIASRRQGRWSLIPPKKQPTALDRQLDKIRDELSSIDSRIESLSKETRKRKESPLGVSRPRDSGETRPARGTGAAVLSNGSLKAIEPGGQNSGAQDGAVAEESDDDRPRSSNERFAEYIAKNFGAERMLRREERIRRNKAIVMVICSVLALIWLLCKLFAM